MIAAAGGLGDLPAGAIEGDQGYGNPARIEMLARVAALQARLN